MECVEVLGSPDGNRRQPRTTHGGASCIRSCERVAAEVRNTASMCNFRQGSTAQWLHPRLGNGLHYKITVL